MTIEVTIFQAVLAMLGAFFAFLCGQGLWDYFKSGRVEKAAPYITTAACEAHRGKCCILQVKKDVAADKAMFIEHQADSEARMKAVEHRLDEGSEDFREVKRELSGIKEVLAGMKVMIETKVEKIMVNS